jgi:hypothetical protein
MFDPTETETERYRQELAQLRQVIVQTEPGVLFDGRFEDMIVAPVNVIAVAQDLIREIPALRRAVTALDTAVR